MIHFMVPRVSATVPLQYTAPAGVDDRTSVLFYEDVPDRHEFPHGLYVFTALNSLGPATARLIAALHERIETSTGVAPLNHPLRTLRRYELLRALHEQGLSPFTVYGAWEDYSGVRFPAFVRPREADGGVPTLVYTLADVEADIGKALLNGRSPEDLVVVEFADTSENGLFTKYSAYVIGSRVVPVSLDRGRHWVMRRHASDADPEAMRDERDYILTNPHQDQLAHIFSRSNTGFGRIDYSMADGRVVCWEINTLPLLRRWQGVSSSLAPELEAIRRACKQRVEEEFAAAFESLLARVPSGGDVRPDWDPHLVREARAEIATRGVTSDPRQVSFGLARSLLRPLKPVLKPIVAATLHPYLARRARRHSQKTS